MVYKAEENCRQHYAIVERTLVDNEESICLLR